MYLHQNLGVEAGPYYNLQQEYCMMNLKQAETGGHKVIPVYH